MLFEIPANSFVAGIVGDPPCNLFDARVARLGGEMAFVSRDGCCQMPMSPGLAETLRPHVGEEVKVGVRPMYVTPSFVASEGCIAGTVYVFERFETKGVLQVQVGETRIAAMTTPDLKVQLNQPVWLKVQPRRVLAFDVASGRALPPSDV